MSKKENIMQGKSQEAENQLHQKEAELHQLQESCQGNPAKWEEMKGTGRVQQLTADITNLKKLVGNGGIGQKNAPNDPVA
jgi:uncharacterized protein YukE